MRMRGLIAALALGLVAGACGQASTEVSSEPAAMVAAPPPMAEMARGGEEAQDAATVEGRGQEQAQPGRPSSQPAGPAPVLYLAYAYAVGFELPGGRLAGVMDAHIQACNAAGPRLCQIVGSSRSGDPETQMEGFVSLRAEPAWLATFRGGLGAQAEAAGGRIVQQSTSTEDLTRQIVDTEARQRALVALRGRLEDLLRSRPGRLADLLEVERELARVAGEIDALQSNLAVMRTRVAMSELTLSYRSEPRPLRSDTFKPLTESFANFLGIVVAGFAAIITIIAGLLPFAIVIIPIVWGVLRWRKARGGRFFASNGGDAPPLARAEAAERAQER